ncbi:MAG TPA: hypothetical protein VG937_08095, partial [Polyangiaceae bacterium]|nr:hypothetical protein [Polyangiaceae bacterium]
MTSHVGLRQGLSYLSVKNFPIYANERATVRMLGINDQLDVSIRVLPWLALNVAGDAFAASGLDGTSFFYGQAIYLINARAGALVRVYRSRATGTQLGVRGYAGFGTGQQLALPGFVQGVAARAAREVPDLLAVPADQLEDAAYTAVSNAADDLRNSAITTRNLARYGGALHLAQVIVPLLGFQSTFGLEGASARDRHFDPRLQYYVNTDSADTTLRFAAALSFDAYHLGVPLA